MLKTIFFILLFLVFYTYIGYTILLWILVSIKKNITKKGQKTLEELNQLPQVCMFITAFNEIDYIEKKIKNTFDLNYPKEKIQYLWLTDGSNDGTPELLRKHTQLQVEHQAERRGKIDAMNRGMQFVQAPIVIFSDSNTSLGKESIIEIVKKFQDESVGCVAGEKRIINKKNDTAAGSGEGFYWQLESITKKLDAELNSAVGAAGELFAIRKDLFEEVEKDTLLDDFIISLRIAKKGYRIAYAPNAFAVESASANVKEELKRKTRIAAGGVQTIFRMPELLNPFKFGSLSFQYISHKVLRWTIAPFALFILFLINFLILVENSSWNFANIFSVFFYIQLLMYITALMGWFFENQKIRLKPFFIPYYFTAMNYATIKGFFRYFKGKQSVLWEKSKRA